VAESEGYAVSDEAVRSAERIYRASNNPADGEAWVQSVLRTTGLPSTFLIARVIETQRALAAMAMMSRTATYEGVRDPIVEAMRRPVTPDDMVSFLRGGREWLNTPTVGQRMFPGMQSDHNAHLPHQRGVPAGDAILCNHANENPGHCPCDPDCYCRQDGHTCSDVTAVHGSSDRECRLCDRDALWIFNYGAFAGVMAEPRLYVCALHLAECRVNRERGRQESLAATVRHHEVVDGDVRHCHNESCTNMIPSDGAAYCSNKCAHDDA
jgi:hypothetical protein